MPSSEAQCFGRATSNGDGVELCELCRCREPQQPWFSNPLPCEAPGAPCLLNRVLPALAQLATSRIQALGSSSPSLLCECTPSFQVRAYHLQETSLLNSGAMGRLLSQCSFAYSSPLSFKTWLPLQAAQGSPYLMRKPRSLYLNISGLEFTAVFSTKS